MTTSTSLLVLDGPGLQPYSIRGLTQRLTPISQAGQTRRDINGELRFIGLSEFQKYRIELSCDDVSAPAFDDVWPGLVVRVESAQELCYRTGTFGPSRSVVSGSERTEGEWTFYRPVFVAMVVAGPSQTFDEWGSQYGWQLELEEV